MGCNLGNMAIKNSRMLRSIEAQGRVLARLRLLANRIVVLDEGQIVDDLPMSAISKKSESPSLEANAARLS